MTPAQLDTFLATNKMVIRVEIIRVRGSSPREVGAFMLVASEAVVGTIGGGQLEYMALDQARKLLKKNENSERMDVPLGPEIGQCCGGRVEIALSRLTDHGVRAIRSLIVDMQKAQPHVYILGAGHVGRALADLFQYLPVRCILVDGRAQELSLSDANVELRQSVLPEADVRAAPANSAFVVLTHDHALDFLLTSEALARRDAAYVGMIGSATKRASFNSFVRTQCEGVDTSDLICPIGENGRFDKRPEVIAAQVMAEVMTALTCDQTVDANHVHATS